MPPDGSWNGLHLGLEGVQGVVTGGACGIGRAIAERLASSGARVIVIDKDRAALEAIDGERLLPVLADMASDDTGQLARRLTNDHGPIQLLVNNVGITTPHRFLELEESDYDLVFRTNLRGPWFFTRELTRHLVEAGAHGSVLFVSSVHQSHVRLNPHYSATKAAIGMLVKELAYELAPHGIRVNSLSPGWIKTHEVAEDEEHRLVGSIPLGRPGTPRDVATLAAIMLSDALSSYVTGADLTIDGGLSLHNWLMDA